MKLIYRCANCGAEGRNPWWEAMKLPRAEDKCPACRQYVRFELVKPPAKKKAA